MNKEQKSSMKSNPKINDHIFKELLKRGYSLEGNTRVWNLADSKLWYLTPGQAQAFLDLEDEVKYKKEVTQKEIDLIVENINLVIETVGKGPINIIDIGCGDGRKASIFIDGLKGKVKLRYCPIDISDYMVKNALKRIRDMDVGEVVEFQWNISDFDNLENVASLLKQGEYRRNIFLLLGNTLGNFEINEMLYQIRTAMNEGDLLIIGNGLDNRHPEEIVDSYNSETFNKFSIGAIKQLGLEEKDVTFGVRFRNSRIESYYTLVREKSLSFLGRTVNFSKGDQIIVIISYKYDKDNFISFLKMYFGLVNTFFSKDGSYSLAFCQK